MKPGRLEARSLEEEVYDALRDAILSGHFQPGDALVEAQLSTQFGISKTPVREALIRLKRDGLVESTLHRTNRVVMPTARDLRQACQLREWIETQVAAECARNPRDEFLHELEASIANAEEALRAHDDDRYVEAIRHFSDLLFREAGNRFAIDALERLRNVLGLIANVSRWAPSRRDRSIEQHRRIYEAIRTADPEAAAEATRQHLRSIEADSLSMMREVSQASA